MRDTEANPINENAEPKQQQIVSYSSTDENLDSEQQDIENHLATEENDESEQLGLNILSLPEEVLWMIWSYCSPPEIFLLSLVSKCFRKISSDQALWHHLLKQNASEAKGDQAKNDKANASDVKDNQANVNYRKKWIQEALPKQIIAGEKHELCTHKLFIKNNQSSHSPHFYFREDVDIKKNHILITLVRDKYKDKNNLNFFLEFSEHQEPYIMRKPYLMRIFFEKSAHVTTLNTEYSIYKKAEYLTYKDAKQYKEFVQWSCLIRISPSSIKLLLSLELMSKSLDKEPLEWVKYFLHLLRKEMNGVCIPFSRSTSIGYCPDVDLRAMLYRFEKFDELYPRNEEKTIIFYLNRIRTLRTADKSDTAIYDYHFNEDWEKVYSRIEAGADVNSQNCYGETALHLFLDLEKVKFLVTHGADVNAISLLGHPVICCAADLGKWDVVHYLIEQGANINAKAPGGETALYYAARQKNMAAVKYLLQQGADINIKTNNPDQEAMNFINQIPPTATDEINAEISSSEIPEIETKIASPEALEVPQPSEEKLYSTENQMTKEQASSTRDDMELIRPNVSEAPQSPEEKLNSTQNQLPEEQASSINNHMKLNLNNKDLKIPPTKRKATIRSENSSSIPNNQSKNQNMVFRNSSQQLFRVPLVLNNLVPTLLESLEKSITEVKQATTPPGSASTPGIFASKSSPIKATKENQLVSNQKNSEPLFDTINNQEHASRDRQVSANNAALQQESFSRKRQQEFSS